MPAELIPGTALPVTTGAMGYQPEGRGSVHLTPDRQGKSTVDKALEDENLSPAEKMELMAALRKYDTRHAELDEVFGRTARQTDGTTGNAVALLFTCPSGCIGQVSYVLVDTPNTATITPTAPEANAAVWHYLAVLNGATTTATNALAVNTGGLRAGLVAFAPNPPSSTNLGSLPWLYTLGDKSGPILQANEQLMWVLVGGSQAGVTNIQVQVTYRIRLWGLQKGRGH